LNPLAFFNKDSNKIVISSINKTVAELNKLFNNSDNISVKDIISVLSKNLDSEFYRTKILAVYFDSR
jgi:hypothetical protein